MDVQAVSCVEVHIIRVIFCAIWLQAEACNFTKSNSSPWVFFTFLNLHKCYQIAESASYVLLFFKIRRSVLSSPYASC